MGGKGGNVRRKLSDEGRKKLCEARRLNPTRKGLKNSEEHKEKQSKAKKGKPLSEAHRKALSDAAKRKYANGFEQYNKGKTLTEEHKKALRKPKSILNKQ